MDHFNPEQVYSSIDHGGRYAFRNQPGIAHWNLSCLARALLPLLHDDGEQAVALAQAAIDAFPAQFLDAHGAGVAAKLGLSELAEEDTPLVEDLFGLMAQHELDFTLTFRQLADLADPAGSAPRLSDDFPLPETLAPWIERWQARLAPDAQGPAQRQAAMYRANPAFIPRNHQVEAVISAAYEHEDLQPFHDLVDLLEHPFDYRPDQRAYAAPPASHEVVRQTFCGT
jgi:uncharacterized protein YdiU (UPF0061 family)